MTAVGATQLPMPRISTRPGRHHRAGDFGRLAEQVDMTVSGAWSRYRRARSPKSQRLGRWQQVLADGLDQNLAIAYVQPSLIISVEPPPGLT